MAKVCSSAEWKKNIERTVSSTGKCRLNIAGFFLKSFGFPWREMGLLSRR